MLLFRQLMPSKYVSIKLIQEHYQSNSGIGVISRGQIQYNTQMKMFSGIISIFSLSLA